MSAKTSIAPSHKAEEDLIWINRVNSLEKTEPN